MNSRVPVGYRFYWDSECRACRALKGLYQGLDWFNRITFVPLNSDPAEIDLGHLAYEERISCSHLVTPEGQVFSAGAAMVRMLNLLPLLSPFVFLFRLLPKHEVLANSLYGLFSSEKKPRPEIRFADLSDDD